MSVTDECTEACEARAECLVCHLPKSPGGRDVAPAAANGYCPHECVGHNEYPWSGHLWPGELARARAAKVDE